MAVLCTNCSGKLIFNPASQKLECVSCGSKFYPEDVADKDAELHAKYYSTRVYTCSHCGAEVITSDTEVSTFCVYCGNPAIVFNRISQECRPDGLIPFKITKDQAVSNISSKFLRNPLVPNEVKAKLTPDNIRGIYIPYWIVNANYTEADYLSGEVGSGKSKSTHYFSRAGDVEFNNVPVDGSKTLDDDASCKLEPFYLEEAKDFDEDYLNGFYSNISDLSYFDLKNSAAERCHKLFADEIVQSVKAKNVKIVDSIRWIDIMDDPLYMMMPVWFFTFKYKEKPYTILVNGQTGKVAGTMPWIIKRVVWISIAVTIAVMALLALLYIGLLPGRQSGFVPVLTFVIAGIITLSAAGFGKGLSGLLRIRNNLRLTQDKGIFKYVKRRQE
ncbi:MAG: hypothetical protein IKE53_09815 [Clostridiales bacterium]|nr:hypothetical protein [Clostridiales bacterium]